MTAEQIFQPFSDRLSRDIRNDLSTSLVTVLEKGSLSPAKHVAENYKKTQLDNCYLNYIEDRLDRYAKIVVQLDGKTSDPLFIALVLWDERLFFEVHEVLEHEWLKKQGEEKLFLQAMIRAAGAYIKLEAGYPDTAARIAQKAIPVLEQTRSRLEKYTNPNTLIKALQELSPEAPKLLS